MQVSEVERIYKFSVKEGRHEVASRIQIPLRLAYAISMHKSQGLSLEKAIIDFKGCFECGQAYTALSRLKTLAGGYLAGLAPRHLGMVNRKALAFYIALS